MYRVRRLASLWNWLPEFRVSAETEHLTAAAKELGVSPSAVSRTIRLLEQDVGRPLFDRVGRRIELNGAGEILLNSLRVAMRTIDEALSAIERQQFVGPIHLSSGELATRALVVPALARLRDEHPELVPRIGRVPHQDLVSSLLRGEIDLALTHDAVRHHELSIEKLGSFATGVYAGRGHRLHGSARCTAEELIGHPFVALVPGAGGVDRDGWPAGRRRAVAAYAEDFDVSAAIAGGGQHLAVLPRAVGDRLGDTGLRRLGTKVTDRIPLFAVWRLQLEISGRTEAVVAALRGAAVSRSGASD